MSLYVRSLHLVWGTTAPREPGTSLPVGPCGRRTPPTPGAGLATAQKCPDHHRLRLLFLLTITCLQPGSFLPLLSQSPIAW